MSATDTLPDFETIDDTHTEQEAAESTNGSEPKRSKSRSAAKTAAKPATRAAVITTETVREVLEVRGALEQVSDGSRALLVEVLKSEGDLDELTAAVLCNTGSAGFLTTLQELRAKVTSEDPAVAFQAAIEIMSIDKSERTALWAFAHERSLVEAKRVPASDAKAATDLAAALKNLPEEEMVDIASAVALLER